MSTSSDEEWVNSGSDHEYHDDLISKRHSSSHRQINVVSGERSPVEIEQPSADFRIKSLSELAGEAEDVINAIEVEYFNDLSLHLYSSHLLRRKKKIGKQDFPRARWYEWPQHPQSANYYKREIQFNYEHNIPEPVTSSRYISEEDPTSSPLRNQLTDAILSQYVHQIRLKALNSASSFKFALADTTRDPRIAGSVALASLDAGAALQEKDILTVDEGMKNAASIMIHELNSQYQKIVHTAIHDNKYSKRLVPIVDDAIKMPPQTINYLMNFLNSILDGLIQNRKTLFSNTLYNRLNWTDIVNDNILIGETLKRCKRLFIDGNPSEMLNYDKDILQHSSSTLSNRRKRSRELFEEVSLKPIGISNDNLVSNCIINDVKYPAEFNHIKRDIQRITKKENRKKKKRSIQTEQDFYMTR